MRSITCLFVLFSFTRADDDKNEDDDEDDDGDGWDGEKLLLIDKSSVEQFN